MSTKHTFDILIAKMPIQVKTSKNLSNNRPFPPNIRYIYIFAIKTSKLSFILMLLAHPLLKACNANTIF